MALTDREITLLQGSSDNTDPTGTPIAEIGRLSTLVAVYATVASWTVSAGNEGDLHEVAMVTDNFTVTEFRLTIDGAINFADRIIQGALSLPWRTNRLDAAAVVLLEARSDGAITIVVDGSITGAERPI